jgi:hypothetical protein
MFANCLLALSPSLLLFGVHDFSLGTFAMVPLSLLGFGLFLQLDRLVDSLCHVQLLCLGARLDALFSGVLIIDAVVRVAVAG